MEAPSHVSSCMVRLTGQPFETQATRRWLIGTVRNVLVQLTKIDNQPPITFGFGHQQSRCTRLRSDRTDNTIIGKLLSKLSAGLHLGRAPSVRMSTNRLDVAEVEINLDASDSTQLSIKQNPKLIYQINIEFSLPAVLLCQIIYLSSPVAFLNQGSPLFCGSLILQPKSILFGSLGTCYQTARLGIHH